MAETNPYLLEEYKARINRVIDYIEKNLDHAFTLEELSEIANFSKFHFHRIFAVMVGETLFQFIQRLRLERAASVMAGNPRITIGQIAIDCGFADQATFARAFKSNFNMSATQWRSVKNKEKSNLSKTESNLNQMLRNGSQTVQAPSLYLSTINQTRKYNMKTPVVRVEELKPFTVAYVRHIGPYKGDSNLFEGLFNKLFTWAGPRGLINHPETKVMAVYHDNPEITSEELLRTSVCISVPDNTVVDGEIGKMVMHGGKYAMIRCEISENEFQEAWTWACGEWLPASGYQPDDAPCFELYQSDNKLHPEGKYLFDICIPVKPL